MHEIGWNCVIGDASLVLGIRAMKVEFKCLIENQTSKKFLTTAIKSRLISFQWAL